MSTNDPATDPESSALRLLAHHVRTLIHTTAYDAAVVERHSGMEFAASLWVRMSGRVVCGVMMTTSGVRRGFGGCLVPGRSSR